MFFDVTCFCLCLKCTKMHSKTPGLLFIMDLSLVVTMSGDWLTVHSNEMKQKQLYFFLLRDREELLL